MEGFTNELSPQRQIQILECEGLAGPAAWGVRRPVVLLPPGMISKLHDDQLAWVLGHELAHHTRYDLVIGAIQRFIHAKVTGTTPEWGNGHSQF